MVRREYVGNAAATTLNGAITAGTTAIVVTDATNWPTGSPGPFVAIIDRGLASEEKVLFSSRTGNTLTASARGFDNTSAAAHADGAAIEHGLSATDIDEVNDHVFDTTNDDHTQYLNTTRHDVEARHTFTAALGTPAAPAEISHGAASTGSGNNPAREDHAHGHNPPACRVFHSVNQSIADATLAALAFDSERFDTDTMHDTVTNNSRITFNTAGVYSGVANVRFASRSDYLAIDVQIQLNGTTVIAWDREMHAGANVIPIFSVPFLYKFAATDFIEVVVRHDNTGNVAANVDAAAQYSPEFSAVWVGTGD